MRTIRFRSLAWPVASRILASSSWVSNEKVFTPWSKYAAEMAARLLTGCMKAMREPGASLATSSTSFSDATSKDRTPACASSRITHGEGLAFTA